MKLKKGGGERTEGLCKWTGLVSVYKHNLVRFYIRLNLLDVLLNHGYAQTYNK